VTATKIKTSAVIGHNTCSSVVNRCDTFLSISKSTGVTFSPKPALAFVSAICMSGEGDETGLDE
jgi:hypothetical protein